MIRVNVSARQLAHGDLIPIVADALERTGMEPSHLCLEVTESVLVEDPAASAKTFAALKRLGVKIAVDDFGTGYASLDYLRRFPLDCVKIDRSSSAASRTRPTIATSSARSSSSGTRSACRSPPRASRPPSSSATC